jgi:hypothetical protein
MNNLKYNQKPLQIVEVATGISSLLSLSLLSLSLSSS